MANPGTLIIDLTAIADNYQLIDRFCAEYCTGLDTTQKPPIIAAAVKANAYGLGIEQIGHTLYQAGCQVFFVAHLDEAIALRHILQPLYLSQKGNAFPRILTLNGYQSDRHNDFIRHQISPILSHFDHVHDWQMRIKHDKSNSKNKQATDLCATIHIDTGMNRLGIRYDEFTPGKQGHDILNHAHDSRIDLVISHFACADMDDHPLTRQQYRRFLDIYNHHRHLKALSWSLANSSGIFNIDDYCTPNHLDDQNSPDVYAPKFFDMVRPGISLYGGNPIPSQQNIMKNVVTLHLPILQIRSVYRGESIGYGADYICESDQMTIATLGGGYADGLFRHMYKSQNHPVINHVYYHGRACPIIGRISMDLITIDITHLMADPQNQPKINDLVEIIGPHQSPDDLADHINTIGYEVLTSLGQRYKRDYKA